MDIWEKLYRACKDYYNPHDLSPFFYSNHVVCALEAEDGQIFVGFCIEGASGVLNLCAERVAAHKFKTPLAPSIQKPTNI